MSSQQRASAHVLPIVAGALILLAGLAKSVSIGVVSTRGTTVGFNKIVTSLVRSTGFGFGPAVAQITVVVLIVSGILVLVGALMLNLPAPQSSTWGVIILMFSILSLFAGGGFLAVVGSLLGVVAGVLAINTRPIYLSV